MEKLLDMLSYRRLAGSEGERQFIRKYIDSVPGMCRDDFGNRWIVIGEGAPRTMFSAHTDSVHRRRGPAKQTVVYDTFMGDAFLPENADKFSNCLGADDAAGCYVMLDLIDAGVQGLYVFHRQEECGGGGSIYFNENNPVLLDTIQRCVAFDRCGTNSIITHQGMERCCSDAFAQALGHQMPDLNWKLDDGGVFTDSANYMYDVPECTNLSVGYDNEHRKNETLNVPFVLKLVEQLINVDWDSLPTMRNPDVMETLDYVGDTGWGKKAVTSKYDNLADQIDMDTTFHCWDDAYDLACRCPEQAADLLMAYCGTRRRDY